MNTSIVSVNTFTERTMDSLPNEMKTYLCSFLDGPNASRMSATSRLYREICMDKKFWSDALARDYPTVSVKEDIAYRLQYAHAYYNKYFENLWNSMLKDPEKGVRRDFGRWFMKALSLNKYDSNDAFICCVAPPSGPGDFQSMQISLIAQKCKEKIIEYIRIPLASFLKQGRYNIAERILKIELLNANERAKTAKKVILDATEQNDTLLVYCMEMVPKDKIFFAYKLRKIWRKAEDKPHVRKFLKEYAMVNELTIIGSFERYGNNPGRVKRVKKWLDEIL
jgi:hypothetical protein